MSLQERHRAVIKTAPPIPATELLREGPDFYPLSTFHKLIGAYNSEPIWSSRFRPEVKIFLDDIVQEPVSQHPYYKETFVRPIAHDAVGAYLTALDTLPVYTQAGQFIRDPAFRQMLEEWSEDAPPGPFFQKVIAACTESTITELTPILPHIGKLDQAYYWFMYLAHLGERKDIETISEHMQEEVQTVPQGLEIFNTLTADVWNIVQGKQKDGTLRAFLKQHLGTILYQAIIPDDLQPYIEYGMQDYARIKQLAETVDETKWEWLISYIRKTTIRYNGTVPSSSFDAEVMQGEFTNADAYMSLSDIVADIDVPEEVPFGEPSVNTDHVLLDLFQQYLDGDTSFTELCASPQLLGALKPNIGRFLSTYDEHKAWFISQYLPNIIFKKPIRYSTLEAATRLLDAGIFPTQRIITFTEEHPTDSIEKLRGLRQTTTNGQFRPENRLQRDLEFGKYFRLADTLWQGVYNVFSDLSFSPEDQPYAKDEAEAAAYEAFPLYQKAREAVENDRNLLFLGNHRYGWDFVAVPMQRFLKRLGIPVQRVRIASGNTNDASIANIFLPRELRQLAATMPDIIFLDGTRQIFDNKHNARLPSSTIALFNFFLLYNAACGSLPPNLTDKYDTLTQEEEYEQTAKILQSAKPSIPYQISQWVPNPTKHIAFGDHIVSYNEWVTSPNASPQVVFVNPVTPPQPDWPAHLVNHQPGYLDDPDRHTREEIVFTQHGLARKPQTTLSLLDFVTSVQDHIEETLADLIDEAERY